MDWEGLGAGGESRSESHVAGGRAGLVTDGAGESHEAVAVRDRGEPRLTHRWLRHLDG